MGVDGRPTRGAPVIAEHSSDDTKHSTKQKEKREERREERKEGGDREK